MLTLLESTYRDFECKDDISICTLRNKLRERRAFFEFHDSTNDLFLNAFRVYTNIHTIILFGKTQQETYRDHYIPDYKDDFIIYGIKTVLKSKMSMKKILYQLHYDRHQTADFDAFNAYIADYLNIGFSGKDDLIPISVMILLKRRSSMDLFSIPDRLEKDYYIYIPKSREEQWIAATIFFNDHSFDFIEKQDLKLYLNSDYKECWMRMNGFLKFIRESVNMEDRHRLLFYSSTILYFLGHRTNSDFDFMIFCKSGVPEFYEPLRLFETVGNREYVERGEKGIYDFSYYHCDDPALRRLYYEEFYDKWAQTYGVRKFEEIYAFGKHHMYFLGIKSTIIEQDIIRRQMRNRPRAIADLIALRSRYRFKFDIPKPPKSADKFIKVDGLSIEEKNELLEKKKGILLTKYGVEEIKITEPVDQDKFLNTVIWALDQRYKNMKMKFTLSEVRVEVGLDKKSDEKRTYKIRAVSAPTKNEEEKKKVKVVKTKDAVTGKIVTSTKSVDSKATGKKQFVSSK